MLGSTLLTQLLNLYSQLRSPRTDDGDPIWLPSVLIDSTEIKGEYHSIGWISITEDDESRGFYVFPNIRYALPPTGERRFEKPVPPPWNSSASEVQKPLDWKSGPICPQAYPGWMCPKHSTTYDKEGNPTVSDISLGWCRNAEADVLGDPRQSEDCLFLDVFVPRAVFEKKVSNRCADHSLAPVVVSFGTTPFIYGSKEEVGIRGPSPAVLTQYPTDPDIDAHSCVARYPIVVSMNYRLGMFGWFNDKNGTQNLGLWDQRLALEWVREHAQIFGGDPDRITLVGMGSGGGGSIMHHLTAFSGKPNPNPAWYYKNDTTPFQRAIVMSPTWHFTPDREGTFKAVMDAATNISGSPISTIGQLKELRSETLIEINRKVIKESPLNHDMFGPVVGGEFAPKHPAVLLRDQKFDPNLKVIVGHGIYHHLRTSPFGGTVKQVHDQMAGFLHGYSNRTLDYILNELYNPAIAAKELTNWYNGKRTKKLSPTVFPPAIRGELYLLDEIMVGCNTRNIAHAFALGSNNHSYAYDSLDASPNAMMGLFSQSEDTYREKFLSFVENGIPSPSSLGSATWQAYGSENLVLEENPASPRPEQMSADIYHNGRCQWWLERGYELLQ